MKKIKFSVLTLLSVIALTFSSCLGDSDNTQYYGGIGNVGSLGSQIVLDNGVVLTLSGISSTELMNYDRVYAIGEVVKEEGQDVDIYNLKPGDKVTIIPMQGTTGLLNVDWKSSEDELQGENLGTIDSFGWFMNYTYGNGYMNFLLQADCIYKKGDSSTSATLVEPDFYMCASRVDASAKIVDLIFGYDNHAKDDQYTDDTTSSGLKEDYGTTTSYFGLTLNMRSLYTQLKNAGLSDDDEVVFNFYKAEKRESGSTEEYEKTKVDMSYTTVKVGYLTATNFNY